MRLVRYGNPGQERPGLVDDGGNVRDLSGQIQDINSGIVASGLIDSLDGIDIDSLPIVPSGQRIGPCVGSVGKIVCVGANYRDHADEAGIDPPVEPILFMKATTAICGPNDPLILPKGSSKVDWEVELGVVIGRKAQYVPESQALSYVAGYCVSNDVSERGFQLERGGQWTKGKSADSFGPLGPWLVTADDVPDPQALSLWLDVDGVRRQSANTADMIFGVAFLISYISKFMTLLPGDVISTGTPAGVGGAHKPPVFLMPGNLVRAGISGLGEQEQNVVTHPQ